MAIPVPNVFVKRWFERAFNNGEAFDYSSLDAQHAVIVEVMNLLTQRLNLISTSAGTLITLASTTSFTATASQTAFTVPSYDNTTGTVHAYTNSASGNLTRIPQASITLTSQTVVTLPAQLVGATVIIDVFTPGNGTTALASVSAGQGASLVGVQDAGGLLTATNVETALAELATNLASAAYINGIITSSNYIKKDGTVAFTANQSMGSHKITNLAAGTAGSNDAARMADISLAALQANLAAFLASTYLALSGGTMSGNIAMGGNKVTGLGAATVAGQAVRYEEFFAIAATQITSGLLAAARMTTMVGDSGAGGTQGAVTAPGAGDAAAGKFLRADALWAVPASNLGGFCIIQDQKANNTSGGASVATTWTKRDLNTEVVDTQNCATLSSSQITLVAGTYRVKAGSIFYRATECKIRLRDITNGATTAVGMSSYSDNTDGDGTESTLDCRFTIAAPTVYEIQYYAGTVAANGLGLRVNSGEVEVYTSVTIIKE